MYIIGSTSQLGAWHTPMKMNLRIKQIGKSAEYARGQNPADLVLHH